MTITTKEVIMYVPNNANVFTAAFTGALAGMGVSGRPLLNANPLTYQQAITIAGAFAQQFDTTWGSASAASLELNSIVQSCEAYWTNRQPYPATGSRITPSFYGPAVNAIIAVVQEAVSFYNTNSLPNPSAGQGGVHVAFSITADGTYSAGNFYLLSEAGVGGLVPVGDPNEGQAALLSGPMPNPGSLTQVRAVATATTDTLGTGNIVAQFIVNNLPVGNPFSIPWNAVIPSISTVTYQEVVNNQKGTVYPVGNVSWNAGDFVGLLVTLPVIPNIGSSSGAILSLAY
jgi:hypothetical protein